MAVTDPYMTEELLCAHKHCSKHRQVVRSISWRKRPLGCRLGLHSHYYKKGRHYICQVCYYEWDDAVPPDYGMAE